MGSRANRKFCKRLEAMTIFSLSAAASQAQFAFLREQTWQLAFIVPHARTFHGPSAGARPHAQQICQVSLARPAHSSRGNAPDRCEAAPRESLGQKADVPCKAGVAGRAEAWPVTSLVMSSSSKRLVKLE